MEADSHHAQDIEPPQNEETEVGERCSGVEDETQIYQQQTLNDEKFLEKVLNQFRWSNLITEWNPVKTLQAFLCCVIPSYWDITSDIWLGVTFLTVVCESRYCQTGRPDYIWGSITLLLVFLPGAQLYCYKKKWVKDKWIWRWRLACLFFPITMVLFKASLLVNQSPAMFGLNVRMAACEGIWESLLQLCLQLFIIFSRSDTVPSILQIAAILTSLLMVSMAATEDLIQSMMNQAKEQKKDLKFYSELSFKERGEKIGQILSSLSSFHSFSLSL